MNDLSHRLLYGAAEQPESPAQTERECGCPSWARCAHFEDKAVLMMALQGIPEEHRRHAPKDFGRAWVCYFQSYDTAQFVACPECGIARGQAVGPWPLRPEYLYRGDSLDDALAAFEQGEERMRAEASQ